MGISAVRAVLLDVPREFNGSSNWRKEEIRWKLFLTHM